MSKIESFARAPRLARFIVVVSSVDTLLVVCTLDIVICGRFISLERVKGVKYFPKKSFLVDVRPGSKNTSGSSHYKM